MFKSLLARLRPADAAVLPVAPGPGILRSLLPIALLAVGITVLVLMFMWREQASYKPLFGARERVSASDMMAVLDGAGIGYRVHPDSGQVLVPESRLGEVRMLLAAKGVVAKLPAGLELMDGNDPLGVSQFVQDVRFRRGLEGELAQSIMSLEAVDTARVHVSVARTSSFVVTGGEKSSASVVLTLKPGRRLEDEQIAAIVNMVAGSTAGLDPTRVTLVDQAGHLLSARVDLSEGYEAGQGNDAARHFEEATRRNVRDLLAPVLGEENLRVSITADVDNDRVRETHERYGDAPKVTSEALREELDRDPLALGVPGSLSNRPVAVAAAQAAENGDAASSAQKNASTRQYAYDRSIMQIQRSRSRLRKLNVAVVLNSAAAPGGAASWSAAQLADVERILRSGLGIDAARGDTLVVSTLAFPTPPQLQPWWQQRDNVVDFSRWILYALTALLAFFLVLRPMMKLAQQRLALPAPQPTPVEATVMEPAVAAAALPGGAAPEAAQLAQSRQPMPVGPLLEDYDLPPPGSPVDVMVDHLKVLAEKEPERVAEVVKQWVQKNVRSE
ncbi:MAG TPA: flagellar basal-body MS-ring/collar protein FliF [Povalibacter sp.]|uniref:flagellar basal-body MS-ring/collar protein FliF n=1 Tax=Povalibacter sp. TaxID=1962978 RepID=UPI002C05F234|nr:flagellar basal-body MS-ring/collar protein FliF [Povalibacter sp.]HMN43156.1 flagellar basal-body MS-ring/collar protein FliF [Povalibacter sp.]